MLISQPPPNKRLKLPARRLGNESFCSAPQLKRDPLDRAISYLASYIHRMYIEPCLTPASNGTPRKRAPTS